MEKNTFKPSTSLSAYIDTSTGTRISNLITKYVVRVLYLGENRNGSFFSESVVNEMCKSIGGIPVIGEYDEEKGDFLNHGKLEISISDNGDFKQKLVGPVPYGFVPPEANYWWEEHEDNDNVVRNYLCTEVYLWDGRYEELKMLREGLNNQSMELNPETMSGTWIESEDKGYYRIDKAEFIGLCILGKDVEPCFEGAGFTTNFSLNSVFTEALAQMKEELNFALEEVQEEFIDENEEFIDNGIDDLDGPTVEELLAIEKEQELEKQLSEKETRIEELELEIEEYKNKNVLLEKEKITLTAENSSLREENNQYKIAEIRQEKLEKLKEYMDEISTKDFEELSNKVDDYTLEELETVAQKAAYKNMKLLFTNMNTKVLTLNESEFKMRDNEQKSPIWVTEVLKRQR